MRFRTSIFVSIDMERKADPQQAEERFSGGIEFSFRHSGKQTAEDKELN
jgi:hypothetical protein